MDLLRSSLHWREQYNKSITSCCIREVCTGASLPGYWNPPRDRYGWAKSKTASAPAENRRDQVKTLPRPRPVSRLTTPVGIQIKRWHQQEVSYCPQFAPLVVKENQSLVWMSIQRVCVWRMFIVAHCHNPVPHPRRSQTPAATLPFGLHSKKLTFSAQWLRSVRL